MKLEVHRDGVTLAAELVGDGERTVLLLPTWSVIPSRMWKLQIPTLARHLRVLSFDGRGSGASDRPADAEAYRVGEFARDAVAVLDASDTARATLVAYSCGSLWAIAAAASHPERFDALICIAPAVGLAPNHPERIVHSFTEPLDTDVGWAKYNLHYWRRAYPEFLTYFAERCLPEPHSSRQVEDFLTWGSATDPEVLIAATLGMDLAEPETLAEQCAKVRCPVLVIHGDDDRIRPHAQGVALAQAMGGELVTLSGVGHLPHLRHPVVINRLIREFVAALPRSTPPGS